MCVMKIYSVSGPSEARSPVAGLLFYLRFLSHVSLHLSKLLHDLLLHLFLLVEELLLVFVSPGFPPGLEFGSLGFPGSLAAVATSLEPVVHEAHAVLREPGFHVFLGGSSPAGSGAAFLSPPVASLFLLAPGLRLSYLVARVGLPDCIALAVAPAGAPGNDNSGLPLVLAFTLLDVPPLAVASALFNASVLTLVPLVLGLALRFNRLFWLRFNPRLHGSNLADGVHLVAAGSIMPHHFAPADGHTVLITGMVTGLVSVPVGVTHGLVIGPNPAVFFRHLIETNPELLVFRVGEFCIENFVDVVSLFLALDGGEVISVVSASFASILPGHFLLDNIVSGHHRSNWVNGLLGLLGLLGFNWVNGLLRLLGLLGFNWVNGLLRLNRIHWLWLYRVDWLWLYRVDWLWLYRVDWL